MHLRDVGPHTLLVEVEDARTAAALASWVRRHAASAGGALDVVPGARTVLLDGLDGLGGLGDREVLRRLLATWPGGSVLVPALREPDDAVRAVEIPVHLDGEDLGFVARRWGPTRPGSVTG